MMMRTALLLALGLAVGGLASSPAVAAGPVLITQQKAAAGGVTSGDPPGFPVIISEPGSYRLATNLLPGLDNDGIVVTVPDVTIDLDGFTMSGGSAGGSSNALRGIVGNGDRLTVKNGTIGGFEVAGISAHSQLLLIVENMRIVNNARGIDSGNARLTRIQNSTVSVNAGYGIACDRSCHIEGSMISNNGGHGIIITTGLVLGNTLVENGLAGIRGSSGGTTGAGYGNNSLIKNASGGAAQTQGQLFEVFPNLCKPNAC